MLLLRLGFYLSETNAVVAEIVLCVTEKICADDAHLTKRRKRRENCADSSKAPERRGDAGNDAGIEYGRRRPSESQIKAE